MIGLMAANRESTELLAGSEILIELRGSPSQGHIIPSFTRAWLSLYILECHGRILEKLDHEDCTKLTYNPQIIPWASVEKVRESVASGTSSFSAHIPLL